MIPFTGGTWSSQIHTDAKYNVNCQVGGGEGGEVSVRWIQSFSLGRLVDGVMAAGSVSVLNATVHLNG